MSNLFESVLLSFITLGIVAVVVALVKQELAAARKSRASKR